MPQEMRCHNTHRPLSRLPTGEILLVETGHGPGCGIARKPVGLWWAFGTEWLDHAESGRSKAAARRGVGEHNYIIDIGRDANILRLENWSDLLDFSVRYGRPMLHSQRGFWWQKGDRQTYDPAQDAYLSKTNASARVPMIDWIAVEADCDGLEIAPSLFRCQRPSIDWLDIDWDVPSGCAWRVADVSATGPLSSMELREAVQDRQAEEAGVGLPRF